MTVMRKWSLLAALAVVVVFIASWFLLLAPKRTKVAELKTQAAAQEQANVELQTQIQVLKAQAQDLPKQRAVLSKIRTQIPDNPALPGLVRDLTAAAKTSGADLASLAPSTPSLVTQPGAVTAAPSTGTLFQVPVVLVVNGTFFELEQFLNQVESVQRAFLVTGFTIGAANGTGATKAGASTGPAAAGQSPNLSMTLNARVFLTNPAKDAKNWPGGQAPAATAPTTGQPSAKTSTTN